MNPNPEFALVLADVRRVVASYKFQFHTEVELQNQFGEMLTAEKIPFQREFRLTPEDRPDFLIHKVAVEIKISPSLNGHLRQLKRYANHPEIIGTILIATRPWGMPVTLSEKPCVCVSVWRGRL